MRIRPSLSPLLLAGSFLGALAISSPLPATAGEEPPAVRVHGLAFGDAY
jgi:hypothetical protein